MIIHDKANVHLAGGLRVLFFNLSLQLGSGFRVEGTKGYPVQRSALSLAASDHFDRERNCKKWGQIFAFVNLNIIFT
jgi:hypothetical protein